MVIINELLRMVENHIENSYIGSDNIVDYRNYKYALDLVKEKLDLVDELENKVDELEADNETLKEEQYNLQGSLEYWQDEYYVPEQRYEKLQENY